MRELKFDTSELRGEPGFATTQFNVPPRHSTRATSILVIIALLGGAFVLVPQGARADAGAPRWTAGDFWLYVDASNPNHTRRFEVVGMETTRTLRGSSYDAWHVKDSETTGSIAVVTDLWMRDSDLAVVNRSVTIFVLIIRTYEPPQPEAVFPLSVQRTWTINVNVSLKIGNGGVSTTLTTASAQVDGELDVTVAAGTFHSFVIRSLGGGDYTKFYYSDSVGYYSRRENYNAQDQKTEQMDLSSHRYQWSTTFLLLVIGGVALAAIAILAFVVIRRRRRSMPPVTYPPQQPPPPPAP